MISENKIVNIIREEYVLSDDFDQVKACISLIKSSEKIAALTGAGISTNAGIPDFRGPHGLYITKQYDPETIFDIESFYHNPEPFYDFARDFIELEKSLTPTFAHQFLADLEQTGRLDGIITQNIDALHQRAGSNNVLELHGSFWWSFCLTCGKRFSYNQIKEKVLKEKVPSCECGGTIKPDVVFFGEAVHHMEAAGALARAADLLFVIGTSCVVYPAALIPSLTEGKIVVINQGNVNIQTPVEIMIQEDIDSFLKKISKHI